MVSRLESDQLDPRSHGRITAPIAPRTPADQPPSGLPGSFAGQIGSRVSRQLEGEEPTFGLRRDSRDPHVLRPECSTAPASRYRGMEFLAALVVCIAMSGSAVAGNPRSEPRSERRDSAASQRKGTCSSCERDSHGRIRRSAAARRAFLRENPCPSTGPHLDLAPVTLSITSCRSSAAAQMTVRTCSGRVWPRPQRIE